MKNLNAEILDEEGYGILFARVASTMIDEGKIDQGTLISEIGVKKFPNYAQGHFILAKCYQEKEMYEEARTEYERVLKYDSSHIGAMRELADIFQILGLNDVYKDYLFRLLTLDPLNSNILDEAREQGVYDLWKMDGEAPFSQIEKIMPGEIGEEDDSPEVVGNRELFADAVSDNKDELTKIDLSQFENQDDDFSTIMDGLINENIEGNEEIDANNYMKELETSAEEESELMAEEKPVTEKEDEISSETEFEFNDKSEPFLEMDFSDDQEKTEDVEPETEKEKEKEKETTDGDELIVEKQSDINEIEKSFLESKDNVNNQEENVFDLDEEIRLNDSEKEKNEVDENKTISGTEDNVLNLDDDETVVSEIEASHIEQEGKEDFVIDNKVLNPDIELEVEKTELQPENEIGEQVENDVSEKQTIKLEMEPDEVINQSPEVSLGETEILPETEKTESIETIEEDESSEEESPYVKQKIVSQTLGEILVSQKKYKEARQVFEALKKQQPENKNIDKKIEILDKIIDLDKEDNE